jgi:predicted nucleic-acid-binding Zn-ribbon protein
LKNSDIIAKDIAFLGHGSKMASIKHRFDKNVLICRESRYFLLPPTLLSFYFGPCISLAIYFSFIEVSNVPLFARILLFLAVIGSWILFVAMLLYHKTIIIDFSSNSLLFVKKVLLKKQYLIDLSQIIRIVSSSVQRVNSDSIENVTTCYFFTIVLTDNTKIRMCETTQKEELNNIIAIVCKNCGHAIEWQDDQTVYHDNKLDKLRKHS